ncbi:hypothetical protein CHU98_g3280 [Xylaria longipes]|nr:hypothetical protein CHU98_g3280 [Xylaria longipes]
MSSSNPANKNFTREHLFDCKGRVALVTGIGLMITQALVANGAKVYITGRTSEKLERVVEKYSEGKDTIIPITSDITSKDGIKKLVSEIGSKESNGLHILVNNAGISGSTFETSAKSAEEAKKNLFDPESSTFEDWTDVYRTNVAQIFFTTTAFLPLLQKASESSPGWSSAVINVTSISGLVKSSQHHFQYNASKAAANHLTRMLASELAVGNGLLVRVNAIAPGVFPSEMTAGESGGDQKSALPKEKYEEKIPADAWARPGYGAGRAFFGVQPVVSAVGYDRGLSNGSSGPRTVQKLQETSTPSFIRLPHSTRRTEHDQITDRDLPGYFTLSQPPRLSRCPERAMRRVMAEEKQRHHTAMIGNVRNSYLASKRNQTNPLSVSRPMAQRTLKPDVGSGERSLPGYPVSADPSCRDSRDQRALLREALGAAVHCTALQWRADGRARAGGRHAVEEPG